MFSSETYSIIDAYKYTSDGSGLDGTFTTGSDGTYSYITGCQSNVGITNFGLTGDFEMTYKFYMDYSSGATSPYNNLWNIALNSNNGVLIGCEGEDRRIRVYNRQNASNTSIDMKTNCYSYKNWVDVSIKYQSGTWSITVGGQSVSYSKTFTPTSIHLNSTFASVRLTDFLIKPL